jgi:tRNA pseudouridine55 synthase
MFGVLNINKPFGLSSRDVVTRVARLVRPHKAGHAGTLDPLATGVLLVCVGQATRLVEYAQQLPKAYRGTFLLGRRSDTDDTEHEVDVLPDAPQPMRAEVEAALPRFVGLIEQRPPRHSAVKIDGQRAYKLARRGIDFEPAAKTVAIHRIDVVRYEYPELVLDVDCGRGTYIRSLGRDLAESLGTAAVMSALMRTAVGPFRVDEAISIDELERHFRSHLRPPALLVAGLPSIVVNDHELEELRHGRAIAKACPMLREDATASTGRTEIAAFDGKQNLAAIVVPRDPGLLVPLRNFTQTD